jgi:hypothetical protein
VVFDYSQGALLDSFRGLRQAFSHQDKVKKKEMYQKIFVTPKR